MNEEQKPHIDIAAGAIEAAVRVCRQLGTGLIDSILLNASQHMSIRLFPMDIVARVVSLRDPTATKRLEGELDIVRHLIGLRAPVVGPTNQLPAGPHIQGDFVLTLWNFVEHVAADTDNPEHTALAAEALRRVQNALASYRGELPEIWSKFDRCREVLANPSTLLALGAADRKFLQVTYDRLHALLTSFSIKTAPIHGDAHLGNVFIASDGAALWNDFGDVCRGPCEWDVSSLPETDLIAFEPIDHDLLTVLRCMRSLCVTIWCSEQSDISEKREAAAFHLENLRSSPLIKSLV
jgi:predicted trehalose synthase